MKLDPRLGFCAPLLFSRLWDLDFQVKEQRPFVFVAQLRCLCCCLWFRLDKRTMTVVAQVLETSERGGSRSSDSPAFSWIVSQSSQGCCYLRRPCILFLYQMFPSFQLQPNVLGHRPLGHPASLAMTFSIVLSLLMVLFITLSSAKPQLCRQLNLTETN